MSHKVVARTGRLRLTQEAQLPPNDPGQAAAILVGSLGNPAALRSAGLAAQRLAVEKFDIDRLAARLVRVLEEAVGTG